MEEIKIINIGENKKAGVTFGQNSSGYLYLKSLDVTDASLMDALALSEQGLVKAYKILNKFNKAQAKASKVKEVKEEKPKRGRQGKK